MLASDEGLGVISGLALRTSAGDDYLLVYHEEPEQLAVHVRHDGGSSVTAKLQRLVEALGLQDGDVEAVAEGWPDWSRSQLADHRGRRRGGG